MKYFILSTIFFTLSACSRCQSSQNETSVTNIPPPESEQARQAWLKLDPDNENTMEDAPKLLSETGIFKTVDDLEINDQFHPYELNLAFWSDSAEKSRWFYIPEGGKIDFSPEKNWNFPVGTLFVKHFEIDLDRTTADNSLTRLETRILMKAKKGWAAYTYIWNDKQTDAEISLFWATKKFDVKHADGKLKTLEWAFPGRDDCFACHGLLEPKILGAKTAQFNRHIKINGHLIHQLETMNKRQLFSIDLSDVSNLPKFPQMHDKNASLSERARAYLDVNCASCHYNGGMADLDLSMTADFSKVVNRDPDPEEENLLIPGGKIILPGNKEKSLVWIRMGRTDYHRMPTISSNVIDEDGMALIGEWIDHGAP
ncbi:MAG: hypothetical protein ACOH5I_14475 [Oligoflexus sp.]